MYTGIHIHMQYIIPCIPETLSYVMIWFDFFIVYVQTAAEVIYDYIVTGVAECHTCDGALRGRWYWEA